MRIDHLVVTCAELEAGAAWVEGRLGVAPGPGGRHGPMGTHNRLMSLGPDCYLEVIAPDPSAPPPGRPRWFGLDAAGAPALTHWAARTSDLDAALAAAPDGAGEAMELSRGDLRWRMGVTARPPMDGAFPMLLQWLGAGAFERLPPSGCRLAALELRHPEAEALRAALPIDDARLHVAAGPRAIAARIEAPGGTRTLGDVPR